MKLKKPLKYFLYFLPITILICSCQEKTSTISSYSLNKADGIYKHKEKPFTGIVIDTTKSGRVLLTFNCIEGKLDGEYLEYHIENGNLKERTTYKDGTKTGRYIKSTKDGGKIITGDYLDFKKNGEWIEYFNNGKVKRKGVYKNGLQSGVWQYFFYNGNLKGEGAYLDGNESNPGKTEIPIHGRSGMWKFYSVDSGKLQQECQFINGKITGILISYHNNGNIEDKVSFKNNELNGYAESYNESGKLIMKELWENGKLISSE